MISMRMFSEDITDCNKLMRAIESYNRLSKDALLSMEASMDRRFWQEAGDADLIFIHIMDESDIEILQMIRESNSQVELVLITDGTISADLYVIPEIRPLFLLKKPFEEDYLVEILAKICLYFMRRCEERGFVHRFFINEKTERRVFPYSSILYFETRNKKVILYTLQGEYEFYDTFSRMEQILPAEFVRCHRSFIVNSIHISGLDFAHQQIELENRIQIPISKKYRRQTEMVLSV